MGFRQPTAGSALVAGQPLGAPSTARSTGVCPQHDLLWPQLTGREHLLFYGRVKGLGGAALRAAAAEGLRELGLERQADQRSGSYSGGMKRRLSVAIALVGGPEVAYLDEPRQAFGVASAEALGHFAHV